MVYAFEWTFFIRLTNKAVLGRNIEENIKTTEAQ